MFVFILSNLLSCSYSHDKFIVGLICFILQGDQMQTQEY